MDAKLKGVTKNSVVIRISILMQYLKKIKTNVKAQNEQKKSRFWNKDNKDSGSPIRSAFSFLYRAIKVNLTYDNSYNEAGFWGCGT